MTPRQPPTCVTTASASPRPPLRAVEWIDDREAYGEERVILLGMKDGQILVVIYTQRNTRIRIISARRATKHEQDVYFRQNAP